MRSTFVAPICGILFALGCLLSIANASMCPFCDAPSLTLAEEIDQSEHVLLTKWVGGTDPTDVSGGTAKFEILEVATSEDAAFEVGQTVELPQYLAGDKDAQYLLLGPSIRVLDWQIPREVSEAGWKYLSDLPSPVTSPEAKIERLRYFVKYLQHSELAISNDAYGEFASAKYETIKALRDDFPREQLTKWIADPDTPVTRMGLYGLLLGLCGDDVAAAAMEKKILNPETSFRLGIEGVISGYLLIKGEDGLKVLEDKIIKSTTWTNSDGEVKKVPFSEVFAVMQALRFMWTYEPEVINKDRLKQSMHELLERPELSDLVIADLARWNDWSKQDRLMAMYDDDNYAIPSVKRAIVRYLFFAGQQTIADSEELTNEAKAAVKNLNQLELKDPKTVKMTKRFLVD
ncbi:MAG: hypothetical protein ABJZ55_17730 [Fuerstiella sp.]